MMTTEDAAATGGYEALVREIFGEYFAVMDHGGEVVETDGATMHDWVVDDWTRVAPTPEELYRQLGVAARVLEGFLQIADNINNPLYTALSDCRERVWTAQHHIRES